MPGETRGPSAEERGLPIAETGVEGGEKNVEVIRNLDSLGDDLARLTERVGRLTQQARGGENFKPEQLADIIQAKVELDNVGLSLGTAEFGYRGGKSH
jgi:hypothetical protein